MNRTSFRTRFFLTFLAIFLLPVCLLGILGTKWATQKIYQNAVSSYTTALENLGMRLNADIKNLDDVTNLIVKNPLIRKLAYMQGDTVDYSRISVFDMQEYKNELLFHCTSSPLYDDIAICFPTKNIVVSTLGLWRMNWFLQDEFRVLNIEPDVFNQYILQNITVPDLMVSKFGNILSGMAFIRIGITNSSGNRTLMSVLFWIENDTLDDYFGNLNLYKGTRVGFYDQEGKLLYAYAPFDSGNSQKEIMKIPVVGSRVKDEDGIYYQAFIWRGTEEPTWQYTAFVPEQEIFGQVNQVKLFLLMLFIVLSLIGCGLSWELATMNYRPFERLFHTLGSYSKITITPSSKNMPQIEQALLSILKDLERLRVNANENRELLQYAALSHLLEDDEPYKEFTNLDFLNMLGIYMPYDTFRVCAVIGYADEETLIHAAVSYCSEHDCTLHTIRCEDNLLIILNYNTPWELHTFMAVIAPLADTFCFSEEQSNLKNLAIAYVQVKDVIRFYPLDSKQQIFYYSEMDSQTYSLFYPAETENNLMLVVRDANEDEAVALLTSLWENNNNHYTRSRLLVALEFTLLKTDYTLVQLSTRFSELICPTKDDDAGLWNYALRLVKTAITYHRENNSKKRNDQAEKLLTYINENICNEQLSLATTAAACGLSIPYLSRLFKENFNIRYLDYVNRKRMLLAKNILSSQKCTIKEAAVRVGFGSDAALRRAFKKYEGIMPSQNNSNNDSIN